MIEGEAADPSVRAVLITGAGRGFSSGADLKEGFIGADDGGPDILKALHEYYHPVLVGVRQLEKPVVAALNGPTVGIGCSLALACDLVLAAESAFLSLAFVNIGLMPDGGSTLFVPARGGQDARLPDGAAGRAHPGRQGAGLGPGERRPPRRPADGRGRCAGRQARRRAHAVLRRRQEGPEPVASTPTWTPSWTSRPSSSTRWRGPRTSPRAPRRSSPSATRPSRAPERRAPTARPVDWPPPWPPDRPRLVVRLGLPLGSLSSLAPDRRPTGPRRTCRGGRLHARERRLAQRGQDRHAVQDHAVRLDPDPADRRGNADLVADQVPGQARRPGRADPRQHAARDGLDDRARRSSWWSSPA